MGALNNEKGDLHEQSRHGNYTRERKAKIMDILLEIYERQEGIKLVVKDNAS